ncbi:MAG: hypothetical protein A3F67_05655 [Verrucomicrobia bacterium RIFCSPHIGHO2_12_FULL_41_10]|nr:MAG: hypothetical protein A3F67_05655 [Verrucomicrobia bacterium RIFCSPHIGHO2_12_FULL_41_10]HLB34718.1 hypothetical protein [Chthoniobacterales bacterium]
MKVFPLLLLAISANISSLLAMNLAKEAPSNQNSTSFLKSLSSWWSKTPSKETSPSNKSFKSLSFSEGASSDRQSPLFVKIPSAKTSEDKTAPVTPEPVFTQAVIIEDHFSEKRNSFPVENKVRSQTTHYIEKVNSVQPQETNIIQSEQLVDFKARKSYFKNQQVQADNTILTAQRMGYTAQNIEERLTWSSVAHVSQDASFCWKNTLYWLAQGVSKQVKFWSDASLSFQIASDEYTQAAEVYASGNIVGADAWNDSAQLIEKSAHCLAKAASYLNRSFEAGNFGNQKDATFYAQKAQQTQDDYFKTWEDYFKNQQKESANMILTAREMSAQAQSSKEYSAWFTVARVSQESSACWEQALAALTLKDPEQINFWRAASHSFQVASEEYTRAAENYTSGNIEGANIWDDSAQLIEKSSYHLAEAASFFSQSLEAGKLGNKKEATFYAQKALEARKEATLCNDSSLDHSSSELQFDLEI